MASTEAGWGLLSGTRMRIACERERDERRGELTGDVREMPLLASTVVRADERESGLKVRFLRERDRAGCRTKFSLSLTAKSMT